MKENILVEDFGGDVQCVEVSAKNDIGIADLLEKVLLQVLFYPLANTPEQVPASFLICCHC